MTKKNEPSNPDGYKEFAKAVTRLSKKEMESLINTKETALDKKMNAEMLHIQTQFNEWWEKYGDGYTSGCATNSEAEGIKQACEAAFEIGYGEGFSVGKWGG